MRILLYLGLRRYIVSWIGGANGLRKARGIPGGRTKPEVFCVLREDEIEMLNRRRASRCKNGTDDECSYDADVWSNCTGRTEYV